MTPNPSNATQRGSSSGWLIPLAALIAVIPLIHHGCSCGHDFDFHLLSWIEAAQQFAHGNLHPHWAFTPAFNAGEPRFVFYPPLSWTLGALLGLLLAHLPGVSEANAWNAAPILFTWIALTIAGFTMHRLARKFTSANAALLAAIAYLANPYMLFTAYERTAYAELLAAAWIPLLFDVIMRERVTATRVAIPVALLWLTNAPAAIMGSYALAALAAVRIVSARRDARPNAQAPNNVAVATLAGTLLGFAISAFYLVPAIRERKAVQVAMATIGGMRINQNFLFEYTGTSPDDLAHDAVLHTASVIAVLLLVSAVVALAAAFLLRRRQPHEGSSDAFPFFPLTIFVVGIAFLLLPLSSFVWYHLPEASLLQFPWRLLAVLAPVAALALAAACEPIALRKIPTAVVALLLAVVLSHAAYHEFRQPCDDEDMAAARLALFHSNAGTDPTDEYTPTTADNDSLTPGDPPWWLAASATDAPPVAAQPGGAPMHFAVAAPIAEDLVINLRNYPAWRVRINGREVSARNRRPDGLIAVRVAQGVSSVDIDYKTDVDQRAGDGVTIAALVLLFVGLRRYPHPLRKSIKVF